MLYFASVAQLAEQRIRNAQVAGSIPAGSSIITTLEQNNSRVVLFNLHLFIKFDAIIDGKAVNEEICKDKKQ